VNGYEKSDAENLQNFGQVVLEPQFFFDEGDQDINADSNPYLGLDGIVCTFQEMVVNLAL
jgi:hypothetical protein